jgi:hypothetical protein
MLDVKGKFLQVVKSRGEPMFNLKKADCRLLRANIYQPSARPMVAYYY